MSSAFLIMLVIAYLLGSISTSILLAKIKGNTDPRDVGSGNAGATNVLRQNGKQDAIIVLVGDILKGFIAVWLAKAIGIQGFELGLIGLAAVVGHIFPVFFKFKGGKGVATSFGAVLGLSIWISIILLLVWIVVVAVTKYVSLASLLASALSPLLLLFFVNPAYFFPALFITALIVWKHQENITRLKARTEPKLNQL